jgi:hypothetical protein
VGGRSLAFIPIGSIFGSSSSSTKQEPLVGGVEKKPHVSGVTEFNMVHEDPIV